MDIKPLFPIKLNSGVILVIAMFSFQNDMGKKYHCNCAVPLILKKYGFQLLLSEFKYRKTFKIEGIH